MTLGWFWHLGVDVGLLVEHLLSKRPHAGRELSEVTLVGLGHRVLPFSWDAFRFDILIAARRRKVNVRNDIYFRS